jgi:hypothetical protein
MALPAVMSFQGNEGIEHQTKGSRRSPAPVAAAEVNSLFK